jgi:hypothetical protein
MPKATLTYDLDQPEDLEEFEHANNARKYHSVLWELDQYLRSKVKYPAEDAHEEYTNTMAEVRDELWKIMESFNIDLNQ